MAKKKKNKTKHADKIQIQHGQELLSIDDLQVELKEKIVSECKEIAKGTKASIYELIEMTKELMALELPEETGEDDGPIEADAF